MVGVEFFRLMRQKKTRMPWTVLLIFAAVMSCLGLMTFLHSGDVVLECRREASQARCTVTRTSLGVELSRQEPRQIQRAVVAETGGKTANLFIELQLEAGTLFLEGTICCTGFEQREVCEAQLNQTADQINAFLDQPAQDSLWMEIAQDSRGGVLMSGVFWVIAAIFVLWGLLRWRRAKTMRAPTE